MCPGHYRSVIHYGGGDAVDKHTTYDKKSDPDFCKKACYVHDGKNNKTEVNVYDKDSCGRYFFLASGCSADGLGTEDTYIYNIALKQNAVKPNLATYISDYHSYYTNELADMCSFYITNEPDSDEPIEDDKTTPVNPDDDNPINQDPDNSDEHCKEAAPAIMPCGKQWDDSTCALVDISNFPPECGTGYEFNSKDEVCACVPTVRTIPRKGENFCKLVAERVNTKPNTVDCAGTAIVSGITDFSSKKPDIVLRNGMKIYNISQNPVSIQVLANNIDEGSYRDSSGNEIKINEYGYTIYVDIDGDNGASVLWDDIYPFYITMSGHVIPAYDKKLNPDGCGGDSKQFLQVSVLHEMISDRGTRKLSWLAKSVSFQEGACIEGYVGENTPYCRNDNYRIHDFCMADTSVCRLKIVRPLRSFL